MISVFLIIYFFISANKKEEKPKVEKIKEEIVSEEETEKVSLSKREFNNFSEYILETLDSTKTEISSLSEIENLKWRQIYTARKCLSRIIPLDTNVSPVKVKQETKTDNHKSYNETNEDENIMRIQELEDTVSKQNTAIRRLYKRLQAQRNIINELNEKLGKNENVHDADMDIDNSYNDDKVIETPPPKNSLSTPKKKYVKKYYKPKIKGIKSSVNKVVEIELPPKPDPEFSELIKLLKSRDEGTSTEPLNLVENLVEKIKNFLERDDITVLSNDIDTSTLEDKESSVNSIHQRRYVYHYFSILHQRFLLEEDVECSFTDFFENVPSHIVKPDAEECGLCACPVCINPELKFVKLSSLGILKFEQPDLEEIIRSDELLDQLYEQLEQHTASKQSVTFSIWVKNDHGMTNSIKRKTTESMSLMIKKFKDEIANLRIHIQKIKVQYRAARAARIMSRKNNETAAMHIDWGSKAKIYQTHNLSGVIFSDRSVTIHAGALWAKDDRFNFASLSDSKDITSVAAWASIQEPLKEIVSKGIKKMYIISTSPVCLYKNKNSFYLMKIFNLEYNVDFRWIYLESWHGQGVPAIVSKTLKTTIEDMTTSRPGTRVNNCKDVFDLIKPHVDMKLYLYGDQEIYEHRAKLPALKIIPGSVNYAEVFISLNEFLIKFCSSEENFQVINRRMIRYGTAQWNSPPHPDYVLTLPRQGIDTSFIDSYASAPAPANIEIEGSYGYPTENDCLDNEMVVDSNIEIVTNE